MTSVNLSEAVSSLPVALSGDRRYRIRLIGTGQGSSGFYEADVLQRDGKAAWPQGTKIYLDHPSVTEAEDRPERSVKEIGGYTISDPEFSESPEPGLYAEVQFGRNAIETIEDYGPVLGMSIRAAGDVEEVDREGTSVRLVRSIKASPHNSIDVVTIAGAKGAILGALAESLRENKTTEEDASANTPEGTSMDEAIAERFDALEAAISAIAESVKPKVEAEGSEGAVDVVATVESAIEAADDAELPKELRKQVIAEVKAIAETGEEPDIAKIVEAKKALVESLVTSLTESGRVGKINDGGGAFNPKIEGWS